MAYSEAEKSYNPVRKEYMSVAHDERLHENPFNVRGGVRDRDMSKTRLTEANLDFLLY